MRVFKQIGKDWFDTDTQMKYRVIYISDTEQYIVFENMDIKKYKFPYTLDNIQNYHKDSWQEIEMQTAWKF